MILKTNRNWEKKAHEANLKGEIEISTIKVSDFNTPLSVREQVDRKSGSR